jgi:hypothetical protein
LSSSHENKNQKKISKSPITEIVNPEHPFEVVNLVLLDMEKRRGFDFKSLTKSSHTGHPVCY